MKKIFLMTFIGLCFCLLAQGQTITVTSPNGGETWGLGSSHSISWTAAGVTQKLRIILYKDGHVVGTIASYLNPGSSPYPWTCGEYKGGTAAAGGGYTIYVGTIGSNTKEDFSNAAFAIVPASPVIVKIPERPRPLPIPFGGPKLAVTAINLVRNASGYSIIFGYKNVGNSALPKRHELQVKPDYRVLIDGREVDKGDLFIPESPPAGPGWELTTQSGGFINFPVYEPRPWYIGKEITIILNERNVLGMGSASKTSSLLPVALTVGYDLAFFGSATFDWDTGKAHVEITKVGASPQLSKKFFVDCTIHGYHPKESTDAPANVATVTYPEGPFTTQVSREIPSSGPFPVHLDVPIFGVPGYSTFYELKFVIIPEYRDEFDERNNTAPQVRFNRPEVLRAPRILSIAFGNAQNFQGKDVIRTRVTLFNKDTRSYGGMRLVLKRNGSQVQEWKGVGINPGEQLTLTNDSPMAPSWPRITFDAYLYDSSGKILFDARSETR